MNKVAEEINPMDKGNRNSAVELLRIVFSIGVVMLHYNLKTHGGGFLYVEPGSVNEKWLYFSESFNIIAVDVFLLISGYYSATSRSSKSIKVFSLLAQTGIFIEIFFLLDQIGGVDIQAEDVLFNLLPNNYFVVLFCVLYLLSPYINKGLQSLNRNSLRNFTILLFLLFSMETSIIDYLDAFNPQSYAMLSTVGATGSQSGYTIINFILVYTIGASLKLLDVRIKREVCALGSIIGILIIWQLALYENSKGVSLCVWHYNHPIVILVSVLLVNIATQSIFKSKVVNELAGASFTSLLFHTWFFKYCNIQDVVTGDTGDLIVHQFMTCIILFLLSYVVYKVWTYLWNGMLRLFRVQRLFSKIDMLLYENL